MTNRPRHRAHPALLRRLVAVALLSAQLAACGSACPEIKAERAAFDQRRAEAHPPDVRLALPFPVIDAIIADHLAQRPAVRLDLPLRPFGLAATVDLQLEAIRMRRERANRVGFTASLGLYDRPGHKLATIALDASVVPIFEPARGGHPTALAIRIRPSDLGDATPTIAPGGEDALAEWLGSLLPPAARLLANRRLLRAAADELLAFLARELWPTVRDRVLGTSPLVDTQIALARVPAAKLSAETQPAGPGDFADALVIVLTSNLPVRVGLPSDPLRLERGRATLRMTGETAAELVNAAMAEGELPARFDAHGKADPNGLWEARAGWRPGPRPLKLHLWQTVGTCKRASLGAELAVARAEDAPAASAPSPSPADAPALAVHVTDARLESVNGPSWLVAFAWLDAAFSSALDFTFRVAAVAQLTFGADAVRLAVDRVVVDRLGVTALFAVDVVR